jgi:hypothetical protein
MPKLRQLRWWSQVVLALFVGGNALPRPSLYAHHHAGGDHVHVHPWGEDVVAEASHHHDEDDVAGHHHHHDAGRTDGPVFDEPDGDHGVHVHWQAPFQHAARTQAPPVVRVAVVRRVDAAAPLASGGAGTPRASARAPPSAVG